MVDTPEIPVMPDRLMAAVDVWAGQLTDTSWRNRLLHVRAPDEHGLQLAASAAELAALREGDALDLASFVEDGSDRSRVLAQGTRLRSRARAHRDERGLDSLRIGLGEVTVVVARDEVATAAPAWLLPVRLCVDARSDVGLRIEVAGDWEFNDVLLHALRARSGWEPPFELTRGPSDGSPSLDLDRLGAELAALPGCDVGWRAVLDTFAYPMLPLVRDLRAHGVHLAANPLVRAIAGDPAARQDRRRRAATAADAQGKGTVELDHLVLPADASQRQVVLDALAGRSLVVQGPPGTGKSQTIANLVACMAAGGKRVLFVTDKRVAADAVAGRLAQVGLDDLVLDLHGGAIRAPIDDLVARLPFTAADTARATNGSTASTDSAQPSVSSSRHAAAASTLERHARAAVAPRAPWQRSLAELLDTLQAPAPIAELSRWRLSPEHLQRFDPATVERVEGLLADHVDEHRALRGSPWLLGGLRDLAGGTSAVAMARRLRDGLDGAEYATLVAAASETDAPEPTTLYGWGRFLTCLHGIGQLGMVLRLDALDLDLTALEAALAPPSLGWRALAGRPSVRARGARTTLLPYWLGARTPTVVELHEVVVRARQLAAEWGLLTQQPVVSFVPDLAAAHDALATLQVAAAEVSRASGEPLLDRRPRSELSELADALVGDERAALRIPQHERRRAELRASGLGPLMDVVETGAPGVEQAVAALRWNLAASLLEHLVQTDSTVRHLDGGRLHATRQDLRAAAEQLRNEAPARVLHRVEERVRETVARHPDQRDALVAASRRRSGGGSVRWLASRVPELATALRPCWIASPADVARSLPPRQLFDLVVFDEASQISPAAAVPVLLRAREVFVVGDHQQLPPSPFFVARDEEEDVEEASDEPVDLTRGFDSILDVLAPLLPERRLAWHYRSIDDRLVAFSNRWLYDGGLVSSPATDRADVLRHEIVSGDPGAVSLEAEAERVAELAIEHLMARPTESLGIVTLGLPHAARIERHLREFLVDAPDLAASQERTEPVLVRNLERVQGEERDAIIFALGVVPDQNGHLRFGPLTHRGGERRLNVAITRARQRMTVVTSFAIRDLDGQGGSSEGLEMLRRFLRYVAASGGDRPPMSPPPQGGVAGQIARALKSRGYPVGAVGHGSGAVHLAVAHPADPRRPLLAIELDSFIATELPEAHDREVHRPTRLAELGWRVHHVTALEWHEGPDKELERILWAVEQRRRTEQAPDQTPAEVA